jgi:hypothetical protein
VVVLLRALQHPLLWSLSMLARSEPGASRGSAQWLPGMLGVLKIAVQRSTFLQALECIHRLSVGCSSHLWTGFFFQTQTPSRSVPFRSRSWTLGAKFALQGSRPCDSGCESRAPGASGREKETGQQTQTKGTRPYRIAPLASLESYEAIGKFLSTANFDLRNHQ